MNYLPMILSARRVGGGPLGPDHTLLLFDQPTSAGMIQYLSLAVVFKNADGEAVLIVASERSAPLMGGEAPTFLCAFDESGHANMGNSPQWADAEKFFPRAIEMAASHVGVAPASLDAAAFMKPAPAEAAARWDELERGFFAAAGARSGRRGCGCVPKLLAGAILIAILVVLIRRWM